MPIRHFNLGGPTRCLCLVYIDCIYVFFFVLLSENLNRVL